LLICGLIGEPTVAGVDKLIVKTTITNTADEILTLLNHPESPLNKLPANTFTITHATGITATFTGIKAKYVPAKAIAIGKDAVTALAPGQSIEVEHNRKSIIRISPQEGEYNIVSNNRFYFINAQKEAVPIYATSEAHTVTLTGKLAVRHPTQIKRATYSGCSLSRQNSLVSAVSGAQTYAADALSYLLSHTSSSTRFVTWFGTYNSSHHSTVTTHFNNINKELFSSYTYDCTCTDTGTYAYVYPDHYGEIHLCGAFWNAPPTGTDSKACLSLHLPGFMLEFLL
ncbi:Peptidyl-Lys metalloendopeptidase, partial [Termitomyces sp. T112]